ncbi:nitroreductase/quinone reductase family protein [Aldersonia kunmingensis]|uniref:nitroreductase/quinone reductase family protein n=1 Tax=Aldersonia kunmingensis TaxID=408066 RepID=UPI000833D929|nr:nitroreductase/quinone reductase family protein [Aldersonia kunmingensis]
MASVADTYPRTEEMAVIHRIFRTAFPEIAGLVRRTPSTSSRRSEVVASYLDFLLNGVRAHHTTEDDNIWPRLLARAAPDSALVERMERQHEAAAAAAEQVRELAAQWRVTPTNGSELAAAIDRLTAVLVEHLDDEETHVVPLIREHITVAEWEQFGEDAFAKFTNPEKLIATGVLVEVATPEEASWFLDPLPLPIRLMWRLHGRRKYNAYIGRVRGTHNGLLWRRLGPAVNRLATSLYRRSRGRVGGTAKGLPVMLVTVPGRRTGTPHTVPVVYFNGDGNYVVAATAGGTAAEPQWFRNLRATDTAHVEIADHELDVGVDVLSPGDRDRIWQDVILPEAPSFAKYEKKAGRIIPVAVLTPAADR